MAFITYILITFFVLVFFGLCILVHELGHFLAAKWRRLHIVAFSLGFKKLWAFKHNGIEYRIGCLPFGGYVDIPQLDAHGSAKKEDGTPLPPAKPMDRIITAFAGPFFNILFGVALGLLLWVTGIPEDTPKMSTVEVASVEEASPEYEAGLRPGDRITEINGRKFYLTWHEIMEELLFTIGKIKLTVKSGGDTKTVSYYPAENRRVSGADRLALPFFRPRIPVVLFPPSGSKSYQAGIRKNDIVVKINGIPVNDIEDYANIVNDAHGAPLDLTVEREGKLVDVKGVVPIEAGDSSRPRIGIAYDREMPLTITDVQKDSPAERGGLKVGDVILAVNGKSLDGAGEKRGIAARISDFLGRLFGSGGSDQLQTAIACSRGGKMTFTVERDGEKLELDGIVPSVLQFYKLDAEVIFYNHPNPVQLFNDVMVKSYKALRGILAKKTESSLGARHLSGPVGIVSTIWLVVYNRGVLWALYFIVVITYSLAVFNLLPIPILDGGHIVIALYESMFRRPPPEWILRPVMYFFVFLLVSLMVFVTYHDIGRLIARMGAPPSKARTPPAKSAQKDKAEPASAQPAAEKPSEEGR